MIQLLGTGNGIKDGFKKFAGEPHTLKRKLSYTMIAIGLIPLFLISVVASLLANSTTTEQIYQNLDSIKANKVVAIENYANTIVSQVLTVSSDPNLATNTLAIIEAFEDVQASNISDAIGEQVISSSLQRFYEEQFLRRYEELNGGSSIDTQNLLMQLPLAAQILQYAYISENPAPLGEKNEMFRSHLNIGYDVIHSTIHQRLAPFLDQFGYYDIFIVDLEGNVVYSVYKELDYATNLVSGAYANSGLGQAFQSALSLNERDQYSLIDYAQYSPSYEAPASFISSPIYMATDKVGVLIFQMPLDTISAVMSERAGLGNSGEAYLVGPDQLMRSNSYKFPDTFSVDASFRNQRTLDTVAVIDGLKGKTAVLETENYAGEPVLSSYTPVKFGSLDWVLVAEIETREAYSSIDQLLMIIGVTFLVVFSVVIAVSYKTIQRILSPIEGLEKTAATIAQSMDFSIRVPIMEKDEIGNSAESVNHLLSAIESSLTETNRVVSSMKHGDLSQRIEGQPSGDLLTLKDGVNDSLATFERAIKDVNRVVNRLAEGELDQRIKSELEGELLVLKQGVNQSLNATQSAVKEISQAMQKMEQGNFQHAFTDNLKGEFAILGSNVESAMENIDQALEQITVVVSETADGNFGKRVDADLPGQLDDIKQMLNESIDAIQEVFEHTERSLKELSEGNLNIELTRQFPGQYQLIQDSLESMSKKLREVVENIKLSASSVASDTTEIARANDELNSRTIQQASSLEQTAAAIEEITETIAQSSENTNIVNQKVMSARNAARDGGKVINDTQSAMHEITDSSERIANITNVIDSIAFQTNLLALNAAVEAARAGEQGRGFAVVASEVRTLAGKSASAAKEIKQLIDDSVSKVHAGDELVSRSGQILQDIIAQVEQVNTLSADISLGMQEQNQSMSEVQKAVDTLQQLTEQNASMVEEASASSQQLESQANAMSRLTDFFKT